MEGSRRLKEALFGRAASSTTSTTTTSATSTLSSAAAVASPQLPAVTAGRVRYRCGGCGCWTGLAGAATGTVLPEGVAYWCSDCGALRCGARCVTSEIEAQYCGQCLDNVTSYDASLFRHRCKKCFRCPACQAPLSFAQQLARAAPAADHPPATAVAAQPQRVVYLHCAFCRWNSLSLDASIQADSPTALVTALIKRERADPTQKRVTEQVEAFSREHREARLRARASKRSALHAVLHTPPPQPLVPPLTPFSSFALDLEGAMKLEAGGTTPAGGAAGATVEQVEQARTAFEAKLSLAAMRRELPSERRAPDDPLPSYPLHVAHTATLEQRLTDSNPNARLVSELWVQRWMLGTRISKRCRPCGKLLIKPDLIGAKTDFKRHHAALFYLPLVSLEEAQWDEAGRLWGLRVVLANPPQRSSHLPLTILASLEEAGEEARVQPSEAFHTFLGVLDEYDKFWETPECAELCERDKSHNAGVVLHRHLNKLALRFRVGIAPSSSSSSSSQHLKLRLKITMGRTSTSEEATIDVLLETDLSPAPLAQKKEEAPSSSSSSPSSSTQAPAP